MENNNASPVQLAIIDGIIKKDLVNIAIVNAVEEELILKKEVVATKSRTESRMPSRATIKTSHSKLWNL